MSQPSANRLHPIIFFRHLFVVVVVVVDLAVNCCVQMRWPINKLPEKKNENRGGMGVRGNVVWD